MGFGFFATEFLTGSRADVCFAVDYGIRISERAVKLFFESARLTVFESVPHRLIRIST
jgi:hypothetical protein